MYCLLLFVHYFAFWCVSCPIDTGICDYYILFYLDMSALRNILVLKAFLEQNNERADDEEAVCAVRDVIFHIQTKVDMFLQYYLHNKSEEK